MSTPVLFEESDCVFGIFVEVSIEYPLVHEIRVATDVEEDPSQVVKLERGENERIASYGVLYCFSVRTDCFLATRFDLCNDREAIVGRGLRKNRPVTSLFKLEISLFGDGHGRRLCPVARFSARHQLCGNIHIRFRQFGRAGGMTWIGGLSLACDRCGQRAAAAVATVAVPRKARRVVSPNWSCDMIVPPSSASVV